MRSTSRAASTKRFAELRIIFTFLEFEPERSSSRTRSKGVSAAAKKVISCGTPSSKTIKSLGASVGGGVLDEDPRTLTFRSTRSESMRMVSTGSWAVAVLQNISAKRIAQYRARSFLNTLVRIIPTFAARHGVSLADTDSNRSPLSIACCVCRTIRQTVHRSQIRDDLLVLTREIRQFFDFVEDAAARVRHLLHSVVTGIERL